MDTITVKVSELYEQIKLMKNDKMDYVTLSILEPKPEEDIPASIYLTAYQKNESVEIDYESVDSI